MQTGEELAGKVALVTGGARNIGRAIARDLAAGGAAVMVNVNTSVDMAQQTVNMIEDAGGQAAYFVADVTKPESVDALVQATVDRFGRVDVLVNNAGVRHETPLEDMTFEQWRSVLSVIVDAAFLCTTASLPHMISTGGGTIINIGGMTGHSGAKHRAHVITGKAAIAGMTKAFALDLAEHGITVNCVAPGLIDTVRGLPGAPVRPASRSAPPPIGHLGRMEDVSAMVRMLCGPDARYITGQTIHVNGGALMP